MPSITPLLAVAISLGASESVVAPPLAPPGANDTRHQITSGGRSRHYNVHTPPQHDPLIPYPIVLVLHGGTGWAHQMATNSHFSEIADSYGFVVAYPEGWSRIPFIGQTWNAPLSDDFGGVCGRATELDIDDVGFIDDLLDDLATRMAVDVRRVFASGHSNGAMMSYRLAAELSHRIAAIAPNAGARIFALPAPRPVPVLSLHGALDQRVPWTGGHGTGLCDLFYPSLSQSLLPIVAHNGCDTPRLVEVRGNARYYEATDPIAGNTVALWWLSDGGHSWPGGEPAEWNPDEPQNFDIQAAEEAWLFFESHPMPE